MATVRLADNRRVLLHSLVDEEAFGGAAGFLRRYPNARLYLPRALRTRHALHRLRRMLAGEKENVSPRFMGLEHM